MKPLIFCDRCKNGIGVVTYNSKYVPGNYCTSDCYADALMDEYGIDGLRGRFNLVSKKGYIELEPK